MGRKEGTPDPRISLDFTPEEFELVKAYFWSRVVKSDGCWEWDQVYEPQRYGQVYMSPGRLLGRELVTSAHRLSWVIHNGPIPPGLCVCHNCPGGDNPACVRPEHLWLGTHRQNAQDMRAKGGGNKRKGPRKTLKQWAAEYYAAEAAKMRLNPEDRESVN